MASTTQTVTTTISLETVPPSHHLRLTSPSHPLDDPPSRPPATAPPDGGPGWYVVLGCAILTFWVIGTSYCWGIIQDALVTSGLSSPSTLSFVGSLSPACMAATSVFASRLMQRMGTRTTALVSVGMMGGAQVLSGWAMREVGGLFATMGVGFGLGTSLGFMVVATAPAQYFVGKRGLANGLVFAGGGVGGAVMSFVIEALIQRVGTAWTFRVVGCLIWATGLPAAWLIKDRALTPIAEFVDWRMFRDFRFSMIFIASAIGTFPLFVPPFFLPLYSRSLGFSTKTGAGLVAGFNLASAAGRVGCGLATDRIGPLNTLILSLVGSALSMLALWPVSTTLAPMAVFVVLNGASNGGFFSTMPTVVGNVFGSARVSLVMGMVVTGWTAGYLMGAPIAGYLLAAYGGTDEGIKAYRPAMFYAGTLAFGAAGFAAFARLRINSKLKSRV